MILSVEDISFVRFVKVKTTIMSTVKKSVLMKYLECPLCLEDMQRSCILQCHHSFCADCLKKYMKQASDCEKVTCPLCRKESALPDGDIANLPPNFFMDTLKDLIAQQPEEGPAGGSGASSDQGKRLMCSQEDCSGQAVIYCNVEKEYLCQECAEEHAAGRFTKKHPTVPAEQAGLPNPSSPGTDKPHHPCTKHPYMMLDIFCENCEVPLCNTCFNIQHHGHRCTELESQTQACKQRLEGLLDRIDRLLQCIHAARQASEYQVQNGQRHISSLTTEVANAFQEIRKKLTEQEQGLMGDLERATGRVNKVAAATEDEHDLAEANLNSLRFLGQSLLRKGDAYDYLTNLPNLEEAMEKKWTEEIPGVMWWTETSEPNKNRKLTELNRIALTEETDTTRSWPTPSTPNTKRADRGAGRLPSPAGKEREVTVYNVGGDVTGVTTYKSNLLLVKDSKSAIYIYNAGRLVAEKQIEGLRCPYSLTWIARRGGDQLVISDGVNSLYWVPVKCADNKCLLGTPRCQELSYQPHSLCVDEMQNVIVKDGSNMKIRAYSSSGKEKYTVQLPAGSRPWCLAPGPSSGGFVLADPLNRQMMWIDRKGKEQMSHKGAAYGIELCNLRGLVRDREGRYLVTDRDKNRLLLFSSKGDSVRCLAKDIPQPFSIWLDRDEQKLYVGTFSKQVWVYDYPILLGEPQARYRIVNFEIQL